MKGIVFDIQRFSLHDGPGIRTTLFFKGCNLKCAWCSNPEGINPKPEIGFNQEKCNDCLDCIEFCEPGALQSKDGKLILQRELCTACGDCVDICPNNALSIFGKEMSIDEILSIVEKDRAYYSNSGGGLTLSGGDALLQFDFTFQLIKAAHSNGISICLETAGFTSPEKLLKLIPFIDFFLFDYKLTDSMMHKTLTGQANKSILHNLHLLNQNGASIILRCIIIPGLNDTKEHLNSISTLYKILPSITKIELLPYHNYGVSKNILIGKKTSFNQMTMNEEEVNTIIKGLIDDGVDNVTVG